MFWIVILLCVCIDQLSKLAVERSMELGATKPLLPGILGFTYTRNTGAAFSILTGKQAFLIAVTAVVMIAMVVYVLRKGKTIFLPEKIAIALIVGGGTGNLICRIVRGYVVDFINIHILPIFNAADIFVCCGCGLLVLSVLWLEPRYGKKTHESEHGL
ncbi:MAG: signal peptidase II [Firmicutes bacterium]|nr:signal peptidase II [Bacillota bacterium]